MPPKLGIVAGGGDLPRRLVEACRQSGRPFFVVALEGQAEPGLTDGIPHLWARLGAGGAILAALREAEARDLVLAGRVRRPSLSELRPDLRTAAFFAKVGARALGDDGLLRAVTVELEREGFRIVGAQDVLRDLLSAAGPFGSILPDAQAETDIARGVEVAHALGLLDVGQAVVVQQGIVLGVEAIEGTDALLERCGALRRSGPGGVLVKLCKPQQDARVDLPTIGVTTVERAAAAGLRGIAVQAGATLTLDRSAVAEAADRMGLFVVGIETES
ncbi:LpxI family protein [Arenibaculum pallidiluteum]|uniref:LpxI family protein n=1 Tax=Arenibaculum pallidiluteum TaxID=2812559 RepID=UPI001A96DD73|nr:UDP-2,3-diacylglucosamine diphosphatase LpxI [Arenibaculum pallidiluteum]